ISLDAVRRVAWGGEQLELAAEAVARMDRCHASFNEFVAARVAEDPGALTDEAQARRPTRLWTAHSFGEPLPERVTRAIVLARLANFVDGHAAVRSEVASAVAELLRGPLPPVPAEGNG